MKSLYSISLIEKNDKNFDLSFVCIGHFIEPIQTKIKFF